MGMKVIAETHKKASANAFVENLCWAIVGLDYEDVDLGSIASELRFRAELIEDLINSCPGSESIDETPAERKC